MPLGVHFSIRAYGFWLERSVEFPHGQDLSSEKVVEVALAARQPEQLDCGRRHRFRCFSAVDVRLVREHRAVP